MTRNAVLKDKEQVEKIVREIGKSFSGAESTKDWTSETIWFDAAPYASVGVENAKAEFDKAFGNLKSCDVEILDMRTFLSGDAAMGMFRSAMEDSW
ncbi:MAG: hypothetical protein IJ730_00530 [Alphaproteobacteria bacterium]|nr:hypothetical protein [Alphaproteobacteria bacterium]